jgi:hypothetical protein
MLFILNFIVWIIIPSFIYGTLAASLASTGVSLSSIGVPLSPTFIYAFGGVITGLQVLAALTEGMAVSVPLVTGSYIASAYYIWTVANGGTLAIAQSGMNLTLSFQPLLFLTMLPSLFSVVRAPLNYLLEQHEAANPAAEAV